LAAGPAGHRGHQQADRERDDRQQAEQQAGVGAADAAVHQREREPVHHGERDEGLQPEERGHGPSQR
jgi:hypothetical protein